MRILHVTTCYPPTTFYTGPPQQLHRLAVDLRVCGVDVRVVTTNADGPRVVDVPAGRWVEREGVPVYYGRRLPGTVDLSVQAWREIATASRSADLIHITAIYSWMNLRVAGVARRGGVPVVVSPRGSLDPAALAFGAAKKTVFQRIGGARALHEAAAFHVTSALERRYVEAFLPGAMTGIVPNGVAVPADEDLTRWRDQPPERPTVLFMGRLHPKKNVVPLVRAWAEVVRRRGDAVLVVAGPDDHNHRAEVEAEIARLELGPRVVLRGFVAGEEKSRLLATSVCLVLPSQTENFGNVVAEALAHGTPVIASTGTPWPDLRERGCGWWVEPSAEGLAGALDEALATPSTVRAEQGARGRRWMIEAFSWPSVARRMRDFYLEVVSRRGGSSA